MYIKIEMVFHNNNGIFTLILKTILIMTSSHFSKIFISFCLVFLSHSILFSQSKVKGNRTVKIEQTEVEDFKTIIVGNTLDVVLIKSTYPSVTIEADSNLIPVINFQVTDSTLNFKVNKKVTRFKEFKAIIRYTEELSSIVLNGDADVETENTIQLDELNLTLNDDAKIKASIITYNFTLKNNNDSSLKLSTNCVLKVETKTANIELKNSSNNKVDINTENLVITAQDSAELDIEGFSYNMEVNAANSSAVYAQDLLTNITNIKASDKAEIEVNVTETLNIHATGSSKIELYGEPKITIDKFTDLTSINKKKL